MLAAAASLVASASAYPSTWGLLGKEPTCTGTGDPKKATPFCYYDKESILGGAFTEAVTITVTDFANETGSLDMHGTGAASLGCTNKTFSKKGSVIDMTNIYGRSART